MRFLTLSPILLIVSICLAGTAHQTDWSGGDGVWGPVIDWGDEFYSDTDASWSESPGELQISETILYPAYRQFVTTSFEGAYRVFPVDMDEDGDWDVLAAADAAGEIAWWENEFGSGTSWVKHSVSSSFNLARGVCSADIDGDLDFDVVGAAWQADDIAWWSNDDGVGTSWTMHTIESNYDGAYSVCSHDLDDDGDNDVLAVANRANNVTWWSNDDGVGTSWTERVIVADLPGAESIHCEDIDGDDDKDVVAVGRDVNSVSWWSNDDGLGTSWTEHPIDVAFTEPSTVFSADIDGDGDMDVVGGSINGSAREVAWWSNDDSVGTNWTKYVISDSFWGPFAVYAADMDDDDDLDVLGCASSDNPTWWENYDGLGTSWIEHGIGWTTGNARSTYAADMDTDGDLDMVVSDCVWDRISWYGLIGRSSGAVESSILDIQENPDWQDIGWTSTEPESTRVVFLVRASDDPDNMGTWSDTLTSPGSLSGIVADQDSLFQYRVIMTTTDPDTTPTLHDVTITWEPYIGTEDETGIEVQSYGLQGALPNPAYGTAVLSFILPADSRAELTVYDIAGRVVSHTEDSYSAGTHQLEVSDLACGVYLIRMRAGGFTATRRFVVID
ncbi:T9SS type A sorting domain-containing protein [Candidatus Fermentibacteria bacterium]|nr:T9SS type A sorting domain-containing protein [Candidatus Fermentibacteria bacterium]